MKKVLIIVTAAASAAAAFGVWVYEGKWGSQGRVTANSTNLTV